jgi:light-regulated signal transduction histidine kinase (bacteriophytochrome)
VLAEGDSIDAARPLMAVDVSGAVASAADLVAPAMAQSGLEFVTDLEPSLTAIAESDGLAQVLGDLLQNAVRYTPSGGTVRLCAERHSGAILVSVTNTGPDIPAADLPTSSNGSTGSRSHARPPAEGPASVWRSFANSFNRSVAESALSRATA